MNFVSRTVYFPSVIVRHCKWSKIVGKVLMRFIATSWPVGNLFTARMATTCKDGPKSIPWVYLFYQFVHIWTNSFDIRTNLYENFTHGVSFDPKKTPFSNFGSFFFIITARRMEMWQVKKHSAQWQFPSLLHFNENSGWKFVTRRLITSEWK